MKQSRAIFIAVIVFLGFSPMAYGQKDAGQLTIKEMREAQRLLTIFEQRLEETRDVEQAVEAVGGKNWFDGTLRQAKRLSASDLSEMGFSQELLLKHESEYRRVLLATFNFMYLMLLQSAVQDEEGAEGEELVKALPPEVIATLRNNGYWNAMLNELGEESSETVTKEVNTLSELLSVAITAERAAAILRTHLQTPETAQVMRQRLAKQKGEMNSAPHLHICNEECAGFPDGTRTIVVNYLLFQLTFAQVGNEMKLVLIASRMGE